jgi:uncharacterized protein YegL
VWLGLTDRGTEGTFVWSDGTPLDATFWHKGEPNDWGSGEDCTHNYKSGLWNDISCSGKRKYVCKMRKVVPVVIPDGNGIILPDNLKEEPEIDPVVVPDLPDLKCPANWKLFEDHCYLPVKDARNGLDAENHCQDQKAHLSSVHSVAENEFLVSLIPKQLIGLTDAQTEGKWVWNDGTVVDFTSWGGGEPNNLGNEDCVETNAGGKPTKWNDIPCKTSRPFTCKMKATSDGKAPEESCPIGWTAFKTNCYLPVNEKVTFHTAEDNCVLKGGHLASIHSEEENAFLNTLGITGFFIGFNDEKTEGSHVWTDKTPTDFKKWAPNEPNNVGNEDCTEMWPSQHWNDLPCTAARNYICKSEGKLADKAKDEVTVCEHKLDIVFVVDESGSIGKDNFEIMKDFLANFVDAFDLDGGKSRISTVKYSLFFRITLLNSLEKGTTSAAAKKAILDTNYGSGGTATGTAMQYAKDKILNTARGEAEQVVIVFTDGKTNMGDKPGPVGDKMREAGIHVVAVGVTDEVDQEELTAIAGTDKDNIFHIQDFASLAGNGALRQTIMKLVCKEKK